MCIYTVIYAHININIITEESCTSATIAWIASRARLQTRQTRQTWQTISLVSKPGETRVLYISNLIKEFGPAFQAFQAFHAFQHSSIPVYFNTVLAPSSCTYVHTVQTKQHK